MTFRVTSVYRAYIRQVGKLPVPLLQHFLRIRAANHIQSLVRASANRRPSKLKRIYKEIRRIKSGHAGNTKAFAHILDLAYGRRGKLRWELMESLFSDSKIPAHPRIISAVEKSRPPFYSPELKTLLFSNLSRKSKPLTPGNLSSPPTLPPQADPSSEEARLFGPFSKRRQVNIRWRYFTTEWKKVYPPLKILLEDGERGQALTGADLVQPYIRGVFLQDHGIHDSIERLGCSSRDARTATAKGECRDTPTSHPSRWLRRRYQDLLRRIPILSFHPIRGKFSVLLAQNALDPLRSGSRQTTSADLEWLELAGKQESAEH